MVGVLRVSGDGGLVKRYDVPKSLILMLMLLVGSCWVMVMGMMAWVGACG